ncbi:MAG: GspE/PulE family protein [Pseudomonadota bacterium]
MQEDPDEMTRRVDAYLDNLTVQGLLDQAAIARTQNAAAATGERIDIVMVRLGLVSEDRVAETWSQILQLSYLTSDDLIAATFDENGLRHEFLLFHGVLPLRIDDAFIAVHADPVAQSARAALVFAFGTAVTFATAPRSAVMARLEQATTETTEQKKPMADFSADGDLEQLRDLASDAPVIKWVNDLFDRAVTAGAADIHIEPSEDALNIRFRVDGSMLADMSPPPALRLAVVSRIKLLAGLDIAEHRRPQDGRCSIPVRGQEIDLRIATAPTRLGETVVIRILDPRRAQLSLNQLGFSEGALARFRQCLSATNGIVLVTGPTGAGKTTTLYAALQDTHTDDRKIMSVEDPIEYAIPEVVQIQASHAIGLNFARVLESILRHNPDVVMVGEIRNKETAEVAIEAALTGHLVLSTLHTNSAVSALTRLREMGLPAYLLAEVIRGVVAQRLVRRLCPDCAPPRLHSPDVGSSNNGEPAQAASSGCRACSFTGYRGRIAVNEVLTVNEELRQLILDGAGEADLSKAATTGGMVPMAQDGTAKVAAGHADARDVMAAVGAF